jgi:hypothetical protein
METSMTTDEPTRLVKRGLDGNTKTSKKGFVKVEIMNVKHINTFLLGFDWWEEFNDKKIYEHKKYTHDYGKGKRMYVNTLVKAYLGDNAFTRTDVTYYVAAEETFDQEELRQLAPFCACVRCDAWTINPFRFLICPCCHGCIKSSITNGTDTWSKVVHASRAKKAKHDNELSSEVVIPNAKKAKHAKKVDL